MYSLTNGTSDVIQPVILLLQGFDLLDLLYSVAHSSSNRMKHYDKGE